MRVGTHNPPRAPWPPPRHLSAGQWLTATRYVVGWREDGIVKVGSSLYGRQRYVKFLSRGAEVIDVAYYAELMDSLHGEYWLMRRLARDYPDAFEDKSESLDHLPQGGGWTECFAVPVSDWPRLIEIANEEAIEGAVPQP